MTKKRFFKLIRNSCGDFAYCVRTLKGSLSLKGLSPPNGLIHVIITRSFTSKMCEVRFIIVVTFVSNECVRAEAAVTQVLIAVTNDAAIAPVTHITAVTTVILNYPHRMILRYVFIHT